LYLIQLLGHIGVGYREEEIVGVDAFGGFETGLYHFAFKGFKHGAGAGKLEQNAHAGAVADHKKVGPVDVPRYDDQQQGYEEEDKFFHEDLFYLS
jgi:hypothetical protein